MTDHRGNKEGPEEMNKGSSDRKHVFRVVQEGSAVKREVEEEQIPVYYRPHPVTKRKSGWLTPVIVTIASAGVIGTILGILMLQLFVGMENDQAVSVNQTTAAPAASSPVGEAAAEQLSKLSTYVLQAGVFSKRANAEEWQAIYEAANEPTFMWEKDNQFYLFVGIHGTEQNAKQKAEELKASNYDVFAKHWETAEREINLSAAESEWLGEFREAWEMAVTTKEKAQLLELDVALDSSILTGLMEMLKDHEKNLDVFYLELMYAYDQLNN